ncbi:uncharacterized protein [Euphorbia lathyris]|uniref:uncharacterized protein n=1 Tax=Euphorbia lathyris TaxID=212925 RepID=UPI0033137B7A
MKKPINLGFLRSDRAVTGDKRCSDALGEKQEIVRKRSKLRDLQPVLRSEENSTGDFKIGEATDKLQLGGEISQMRRDGSAIELNRPLDLNTDVRVTFSASGSGCAKKYDTEHYGDKCVSAAGIGLDLNAEDDTSSEHHDSFYSSKTDDHLKSRRDASECGSTSGPVEQKDSLRLWKEMKENGFLSSSSLVGSGGSAQTSLISSIHGGIPMPKQRGRKSKSEVLKKNMELAKKEQVDRFTKIAAPSGLLNGLNPGIINHVRNKKQVHSIIEALVRSEKPDQDKHQITETKQTCNVTHSGAHQFSCSQPSGVSLMVSGYKEIGGCNVLSRGNLCSTIDYGSDKNLVSHSTAVLGNEAALGLRLSSMRDDSRTCSNEESINANSVSSLSVRAASVASQWLELLHQDIKGRLSALRRSKKRVRAVISTELPFLISKEFTSNQENDPCVLKNLSDGQSSNTVAAMHQTRWRTLFDQMDKALSDEEKQLESWFSKVKEMQLHCDQGLQSLQWSTGFSFLQQQTSENCTRIRQPDSSERDLAVRAAAASIYSTCSFLMSKENVSCC